METKGNRLVGDPDGRIRSSQGCKITRYAALGVAGLWLVNGAAGQGATKGAAPAQAEVAGKKPAGVDSSYEVFHAPVKKIFATTDGRHRFVAYVVDRNGTEVIVSDTLAKSRFQVGDSISVIAHKVTISKATGDVASLSFSLSGASLESSRPPLAQPPVSRSSEVRPGGKAGPSAEDRRRMRYVGGDLTAARTDMERYFALGRAAKAALKAGRSAEAEKLAKELLGAAPNYKGDWNHGNAIHDANQVLGKIALAAGDFEAVEIHLLASVDSKGSPQLNSFGPGMSLAGGLLAEGGKAAVLRYLERCRTFWKPGADRLEGWIADIKAGRSPDFGRSMRD